MEMKRTKSTAETTAQPRCSARIRKTPKTELTRSSDTQIVNEECKIDLSHFEYKSKRELKPAYGTKTHSIKRQQISIEYDKVKTAAVPTEEPDCDGSEAKRPPHWEQVLQNIREMRQHFDAPVDSMGCDECSDKNASPEDKRFQVLLSLMLSSQTKDETTHAAMLRLRNHGCTLTNVLRTSDQRLGELIYPVSFWKTKVKHIKKAAEMIRETFDGDIPETFEDLCKLPGVGPKMAHLCMKSAWGKLTGIGVDTHVHRISNRLGWAKTKTPQATGKALEEWLPRDLWIEMNNLFVGFGQQTCQPVKPRCKDCLNNRICPFGKGDA